MVLPFIEWTNSAFLDYIQMELKWQHSGYSLQALSNFYTIELEFCRVLLPWDKLLCLLLYTRNVKMKRENRSKLNHLIFQCMYSSLEKAKDNFLSDFLKFNNVSAGTAWNCLLLQLIFFPGKCCYSGLNSNLIPSSQWCNHSSLFDIHEVQQQKKEEKSFI